MIADIETDKATIEIEAAAGGKVLELLAQPGDVVAVGSPIATVGAEGEAGSVAAVSRRPSRQRIKAHPHQTAVQKASRKRIAGSARIRAAADARTDQWHAAALNVEHGGTCSQAATAIIPAGSRPARSRAVWPMTRGLDLRQVKGSGPGGRIVSARCGRFPGRRSSRRAYRQPARRSRARPTGYRADPGPPCPPRPLARFHPARMWKCIDISKLRRRIAQRMVESQQQVPHFYVTSDIDVDRSARSAQAVERILPTRNTRSASTI